MIKFLRYYRQNRKKIWRILLIIAFALILLQLLNFISRKNNEERIANVNYNTQTNISTNTSTVPTNQSVVTGEGLSDNKLKKETDVIDKFISYCNEKELQKAYDLLTDECKNQMYETLEVFEKAYYNNVFDGNSKVCTIENWIDNTYKVDIIEDSLSTGKSNNGYSKQDYITIKKVNDNYKLNINSYIGYKEIKTSTNSKNINMEVLDKNTYMDYEEYTIKVTNNTGKDLILDTRTDVKSLHLEDEKKVKYSSYSNELTDPMLTLSPDQTKEITIKFYSSFVSTKKIKYIVFSDIILYEGQLSEKIEFKANV